MLNEREEASFLISTFLILHYLSGLSKFPFRYLQKEPLNLFFDSFNGTLTISGRHFRLRAGFFLGRSERMTTFAPNFRKETKVFIGDVFNLQHETISFGPCSDGSCAGSICQ